ncbi:hypothetical protein D3C87_244660 [compost metagenome]
MAEHYVTFKKFPDASQAKGLQQFLIENGIECLFVDDSPRLGSSFSSDLLKEYEIQMHPDNFEKANTLLEEHAENFLKDVPEDYYLFTFTDEELHDVVLKHDEWSEFDYMLARKLLDERGKTIDEAHIKDLRAQRIADLAKPEGNQQSWVIMGYVFSLLGGFFGIITGYVLWSSKKTLPNGEMVPTYSETDRMHGKNILILGIIVLVVVVLVKVLKLV